MIYEIDETDSKIISFLQKDGRMQFKQIAEAVGLSETTIRNRVRHLRENNIIQIVAIGNPINFGYTVTGNLRIQIDPQFKDNVLGKITKIDEIWYVAIATGPYDLDTEFIVKSFQDLEILIFEKLYNIKGITHVETSITMKYLKRNYEWGSHFT